MKIKQSLLGSAAVLCAFSLACKGSGMLFRIYLSNRIGSEGIGLYQLILSMYSLFASFATAGFAVSVSKIAAEELEGGGGVKGAVKALKSATRLALVTGTLSAVSLLALSYPLSQLMLKDTRAAMPLRVLALSMPFASVSACIKGYYIASRKIIIPASCQLAEELCKISCSIAVTSLFLGGTTDIGRLCLGITVGLTCGEIFSMLYITAFRVFGRDYRFVRGESRYIETKRITGVALPIAASSWLTGGLHTVENVLIPYCFTLYGGGQAKALSDFGMIRGMVIPVLFFPFAFLSALISILIPEISRLNTFTDKTRRDMKMQKTLGVAFVFGIAVGGIFFFYPAEIGKVFYRTADTANAFRLLALVTPFMYIETISDGLLKGIGEQAYTMRVTLYNCAFRIGALFLLIPSTGAVGYLWLLIASNTFSFVMCLFRILKVSSVRIGFIGHLLLPVACAAAAGTASRRIIPLLGLTDTVAVAAGGCVLFAVLYLALYALARRLAGATS